MASLAGLRFPFSEDKTKLQILSSKIHLWFNFQQFEEKGLKESKVLRSKVISSVLAVLVALASNVSSRADVIFTVQNSPNFTAGSVGTVSVFISSTVLAGEAFNAFNLPLDLQTPAGVGLPTGITFAGYSSPLFANTTNIANATVDFFANGDQAANVTAPGVGAPLKLFDMNFNIGSSVPAGSYPVVIPNSVLLQASNAAGGTLVNAAPISGSLNVVPEPSLMGLGVIGLAAFGFRRRRVAC